MKKGYSTLAVAALAVCMIPAIAGAWNFDYEIYGNILDSPAYYGNGSLTSGGTGFIEFTLDDTGWPLDPNQRWNYLWQNYFKPNYDTTTVGAYKWVGSFTGTFYIQATNAPVGYNGWCLGTITPKITIWDTNSNGALDLPEKWGENLFDARLSKLCDHLSGGEMDCKWGWGALASNYFSIKVPPELDTLYNGGNLTLMAGCASSTNPSSWSSIKALYR
jgi:hypothetical protein